MSNTKTTKQIYYLRAKDEDHPLDLQSLIDAARNECGTVAETEMKVGSGEVLRIQHYRNNINEGVLLHLVRYVPGENAPVLEPGVSSSEGDEDIQEPPDGMEYKDGECFLFVNNFHVFFCGHGITNGKAANYLRQWFRHCNLQETMSIEFDLVAASNLDKLALISKHGAKSVKLKCSAFQLSMPNSERETLRDKLLGYVGDQIRAIAERDDTEEEQMSMEDILVNIELKLDGNTRAIQGSQDLIEETASTVLDEEAVGGFEIVTQTGETITPNDIRIRKAYQVTKHDRSVDYDSVFKALINYSNEIRDSHILEQ